MSGIGKLVLWIVVRVVVVNFGVLVKIMCNVWVMIVFGVGLGVCVLYCVFEFFYFCFDVCLFEW